LERIFGSAAGQALIFRGMQRAFKAAHSQGLRGTLQYHLDGRRSTRSWVVRIANGSLQARRGIDPHPTATLRMPSATFARIAAGIQTAAAAAMTGNLQLEGDLRLVARFGEVLQPLS
jgi:putative sterol carrier protein